MYFKNIFYCILFLKITGKGKYEDRSGTYKNPNLDYLEFI